MPEELREDAKAKTERGELAEEVRDLFRQKAYGMGAGESPTELERKKAELESVRNNIDNLRHRRRQTGLSKYICVRKVARSIQK
jgi:hypothetical protein